jgi:hypothetical protein
MTVIVPLADVVRVLVIVSPTFAAIVLKRHKKVVACCGVAACRGGAVGVELAGLGFALGVKVVKP